MIAIRLNRATLIAATVVVAVALQGLDLHSTLAASVGQGESNPLIRSLAERIGGAAAITVVKAVDIAIVLVGAWLWREAGPKYDKAFAACFTVVGVTYGVIVANNYFSR